MARARKSPAGRSKTKVEDPRDEYLSLFVLDRSDKKRGETIGIEGDQIIIKDGPDFLMVPLSSIELEERKVRLVRRVDWNKARMKGEKWRKEELDPLYGDDGT